MLLGNFKRKAYDRYIKSKAASGDKLARQELIVKDAYNREYRRNLNVGGFVEHDRKPMYAKRLGLDLTDFDSTTNQTLLRGGRYKKGGFTNVDTSTAPNYIRTADKGWINEATGKGLPEGRLGAYKNSMPKKPTLPTDEEILAKKLTDMTEEAFKRIKQRAAESVGKSKNVELPKINLDSVYETASRAANIKKPRNYNKARLALGALALGTVAAGSLITVKNSTRKTKKGKTITVKGYSRKRKKELYY